MIFMPKKVSYGVLEQGRQISLCIEADDQSFLFSYIESMNIPYKENSDQS